MVRRKKSLFDFTVEELGRELVAREAKTPMDEMFKFGDTEGTPEREAIMERIKTLYRSAPPQNEALRGFDTEEIAKILLFKIGKIEIDGVRGVWDEDKRLDFYQAESEPVRKNAGSVAAICNKSDLIDTNDGYSELRVKNFKEVFNLCDEEPFSNQCVATGRLCTGFLVKENIIATAAHCIADMDVTNLRFVFGYRMTTPFSPAPKVSNRDIYKVQEIVARAHNRSGNLTDWALVKLDRTVEGREIVTLSEKSVYCNQPIYAIGYPCGLPLKVAPGAFVNAVYDAYFSAHLDIYSGNSGSPVFDSNTHKVVGIVVRGDDRDFRWMGKGWVSVIYPNPTFFSKGSECTRVSEFRGLL